VSADVSDSFVDNLRVQYPFTAVIGEIESYSSGKDEEEGVCTIGGVGMSTGKRVRINY
jgi:hypothetical protein